MDPVPTIRQISNASLWEFYKTYIQGHLGNYRVIGDSLLDCDAKHFLARAGKPGGKAALGMLCIFIFNWVTVVVIVKFICGFGL